MSFTACNRAVPENTTAGKSGSAQPAVGDVESDETTAPEQLSGSEVVKVPSRPQTGSSEDSRVLPPVSQPVRTQAAELPAGGASKATVLSGSPTESSTAGSQASSGAIGESRAETAGAGVHIEMTTSSVPKDASDASYQEGGEAISQPVSEREFMKLAIPESNRAEDLLQFFGQCDKAIQELTITAHTQQMSEAEFHDHAKRLSRMKLEAAERMLALSGLTPEQQRSATSARVESLSHLTSLGDVPSAQQLQSLAQELSGSNDHQLAHQGKLVLLGFRLNELLEGQVKDPQTLLTDMDQLFQTPEDRGLVELMSLQRCADVLAQLGYEAESKQVLDLVVKEYRNSPDADLSMRAWALETNGAAEAIAFNEAVQATLAGTEKDPTRVARASSKLLEAFPSVNTLWHVTRLIIPLEFSGNVAAASEVAKVAAEAKGQLPSSPLSPEIDNFLDCHARRLALLGKRLELKELATFDGKPFDWTSYRGKVVLVCFWASWELNSLAEIEKLTRLRQEITDKDFEVVTINLDDQHMSSAEQMVADQGYPWASLRSSNANAIGFKTPVAKELGVNAVPFVLLVDREGRVAAIHARGEKTATMINELLSKS